MNKQVEIDNIKYEIIKNNRDGFVLEDFKNKLTDYFHEFDYVVGDWAYGKLRLKGFYDDKNSKANKINKYSNLDKYLEENCAFGCKYFVAKKNK